MGGSIAMLSAIDIALKYSVTPSFISFEAPRMGNKEFAKFFNRVMPNAIRITHFNDIVPHVPF